MILESCVSELTRELTGPTEERPFRNIYICIYVCIYISYSKAVDSSSLAFSLFCTRLLGLFVCLFF